MIVTTPNALHAPQTIGCLQAGKQVLVEKPMATHAGRGRDDAGGRRAGPAAALMVAHCWRFHDDVRALRARVEAGELGTIVKTRGYSSHAALGAGGWFTDPELAGGGALVDMGVHAIDTPAILLGDPSPGAGARRRSGRATATTTVDDDGELLIRWDNGVTSWSSAGWWQPHVAAWRPTPSCTAPRGTPGSGTSRRSPRATSTCAQSMYTAQVAEFIDAFGEGRQARPDGEDGAVVMRVVDEAYRSAGLR